MQINRRNFLKIAGVSSAGVVISKGLTGCSNASEAKVKPTSSALNNIYDEAYKKHPQIFNMSGYAAPKLETVRVGVVGLGNRGSFAVERLSYIDGLQIAALCDIKSDQVQKAKERIKSTGHPAVEYSGKEDSWKEMCESGDIDLVYICTPWSLHAPIGVYAMEQGKHAAIEVPAATTVEECWNLVETSEKTKKHCVILENCCYDFFELLTLNLARNGFFGDIVHTEGGYIHEIAEGMFFRGEPGKSWRLVENMKHNGNLYPTHGLGPVAQIMNINRGNRMEYLTSTSTKDFQMNKAAKELAAKDENFKHFVDQPYRGNMNSTVIRTVAEQTILIQHDVTSPRPYSRLHLISGTEGVAQKYPEPPRISDRAHGTNWYTDEEFKALEEKYNPPLIKKMQDIAKQIGGHGGMDFLMDWRLIDCLRNGLPVDMDVYDAAAWSVIGPLSEWSVANRSMPIDIPDFTNGSWETNKPHDILLEAGGNTGVRV